MMLHFVFFATKNKLTCVFYKKKHFFKLKSKNNFIFAHVINLKQMKNEKNCYHFSISVK